MKIGIISDTHDNLPNLKTALEALKAEEVTRIFHCGDVCGPAVVRALSGFDLWIAQGNMDRHPGLIRAVESTFGRGHMAWMHKLTLDGYAAALLHGDNEEVLGDLVASGRYAYVFHGHTHRRRDQTLGRVRVINPGALGGTRWQARSFCVLDLATDEACFVKL